jgi:hypothetical protein
VESRRPELDRLFRGIYAELVAAGAAVCDDGDLSRMSIRVSGHELHRSGRFSDPAAVLMHLLSRPLLESPVRRRVSAVDNVEFLDGHDFVEPIAPNEHRVSGARVVNRDTGAERAGRSANYASLLMRIPAGIVNKKMTFVVPEPKRPTGGAFSVYEHDTRIFTVARLAQNEPPGDLATMIRMATQFAPPALLRALKRGEPLGDVAVFRYPGGAWRRYDQMQRFPAGLLGFGDAICSTNPIYGQGMTVAALEATALQECLAEANGDLSQRFFAAAGELIGPLWASNQFNDLYMANADPAHSASKEMLDFREAVLSAAEDSPALAEKLFRSMNLVDPPTDYSPLIT